jgi:uncharacterized protein YkwD
MGRVVSTAVAAIVGALGVAGWGADPAVVRPAAESRVAGTVAVEQTDGRSPAARLAARRRGVAPRRHGFSAGAACAHTEVAASVEALAAMAEATLCLLNGERADHGLAPLAPNRRLAAAATAYAQDLVAGSYFSHTGRDGSGVVDRVERTGYLPPGVDWMLGENLAWGTGALATPASIMRAWMDSPGHRENILNPGFREIGVGVATGNPSAPDGLGATYATEFGLIEAVRRPVAKRASRAPGRRKRARPASTRRAALVRASAHIGG